VRSDECGIDSGYGEDSVDVVDGVDVLQHADDQDIPVVIAIVVAEVPSETPTAPTR
jgi:hypothetical protein